MITQSPSFLCALCATKTTKHPIIAGDLHFCCPGCHVVFNILSTKNQLTNAKDSPLFQQALRSGLISNPQLLKEIQERTHSPSEGEVCKIYFEIKEMWCPSCAEVIKWILLQKKGIRSCVVDYTTDMASVEYFPRYLSKDDIFASLSSLGYEAVPLQGKESSPISFWLYLRFAIAAFCALNLMMFAYPIYASLFVLDDLGYSTLFAWISFATSIPVVTFCFWPIFRRSLNTIRIGMMGMEVLVTMGVTAAFSLSVYNLFTGSTHIYFDSMSVIVALVLGGKIIENKAKFSAKDSILRLSRATPKRGRKRFADGTEEFVPIKDIQKGDTLVAFNGEKIVLDGIVAIGEGACDESLMTGESLPKEKSKGDRVLAGTFVQNGVLIYQVTATIEETALHKIIDVVEHDVGYKTAYIRAADKIIRWFVPVVLAIAIASGLALFLFGEADPEKSVLTTIVTRIVSILLISCPCAIGIAAPLAESSLIHALAAVGALVRNRGALPFLGKEEVMVFDKTGTITEGKFHLLSGTEALSLFQLEQLKSLASPSTHPISTAIAYAIEAVPLPLDKIEEYPGKGMCALYNNQRLILGSKSFLIQNGVRIPDYSTPSSSEGITTTVYFGVDNVCLATLTLGDQVRKETRAVIQALSDSRTILLSGDAEKTVAAVAAYCGFSHYQAECHPLQKREYVDTLRKEGKVVCMMGDGINDAPALACATVGISVASATDISIQVSDILLTTECLNVLPEIRRLGKKGGRLVTQNLFWAFFYNVIGIALAAAGMLSPLFATFAMVTSSVIVILNARRL